MIETVKLMKNYINHPQKSTILVFCFKYKTIDKRSAIAKALQKNAVFLETKKRLKNYSGFGDRL